MVVKFPLISRKIRYSIALVIAVMIFYFSVVTVPPRPPRVGPFWDKKLHFIAYGIFTLILLYSTVRLKKQPILRISIILGIVVGYGVIIELLQAMVPYRHFSFNDILANIFGGLLGMAWILVEHYIEYRKTKITEITTIIE